jgi:predicted aspartyl protease
MLQGKYYSFCLKIVCLILALVPWITFYTYANIPPGSKPVNTGVPISVLSLLNPDDEPLGDFQSITIPLKRAGRLFLIEARIDDQVGNLIFDTGASGLVLNKTYFRKYIGFEKPGGAGVTGSFDKMARIVVKRIDISQLFYEDVAADIADLGHIENRRGVKILGLFGLNMINNFEIVFDANRNELQLNRIDKHGNLTSPEIIAVNYDFTQKIEKQNNILLIEGIIGDKTLNFCLDTGAESNVISSSVSKKVLNTIQINRRTNLGGAGAQSNVVLYGTMNEFRFGSQQFGKMEAVITNLDTMSEAYGCSIDGMLGYDFWQKGVFRINFGKGEISFKLEKGESK